MEIKEFIAVTVKQLSEYNLDEQVDIFNEIKLLLLESRKQVYEENEFNIKSLVETNQMLQNGNYSIVGDVNTSVSVKGEDLAVNISRNRSY